MIDLVPWQCATIHGSMKESAFQVAFGAIMGAVVGFLFSAISGVDVASASWVCCAAGAIGSASDFLSSGLG